MLRTRENYKKKKKKKPRSKGIRRDKMGRKKNCNKNMKASKTGEQWLHET